MKPHGKLFRALSPLTLLPFGALIVASPLAAQAVAPAVDAATLAKYDRNKNGVLDPDEVAAMQADQARGAANGATAAGGEEKPLALSPFTVSSERDTGYFAQNTLAGSRLNTNLSDLAASITVVTKQQMEDTASLDLNDVFRYETNTEGSSTYTPATSTFRSDGVLDVIAGGTQGNAVDSFTNSTANRVRGIGVPSAAINFYPAIDKIPVDAYNVQSLEISRGPNSMLFGMGSPAGIVNQSAAQAALNRNTNTVSARFDDRGSYRGTLSLNRGLIKDKLAAYGAFLYDNRRFERKPSFDLTRRQYGALTFKPFSGTVIRASVEGYTNYNRRPNTLTPRDFISQWRRAGEPVYDPLTKKITLQRTGQVIGPYVINALSPLAEQAVSGVQTMPGFDRSKFAVTRNSSGALTAATYNGVSLFGEAALANRNSILYVPGIAWVNQARTTMQVQDGQLQNWFQPLYGQRYRTAWGIATNPAANAPLFPTAEADIWANPTWADLYNRDYTSSAGWTNTGTNVGNYKYPGVTDRSVYDWKKLNVNQMNFGRDRNTNSNVELEQKLLDNLYLSGGWFRQDFRSATNYTVAQLNVATLFVDTNKNLPDGTPNPFFGKPYVEDFDPDRYINAERDDHYRAMLAYTPDFTGRKNWLHWLGHHQLLGLWSKDDDTSTAIRQRLEYLDSTSAAGKFRYLPNENNNADGSATGWNFQTTSLRRAYYLANPGDAPGVVTRSSGEWNPLTYANNIKAYDYANSRFDALTMTTTFNTFDAGTARNQRVIDSLSGGMTNYLWSDRLVTTFGLRRDKYKAHTTTNGTILDDSGKTIAPALTSAQKWVNGIYQTQTIFNRWNRWDRLKGTTKTGGGVLRPFRGWRGIESRAESGSPLWQFVRDFGVSYNWSDNFNAPPSAQVDAFGTPLSKPTGVGRDYGFQFSTFNNKLFARVTWFEATNQDERTSPGASIGRLTSNIDTTLFRNWARTIAMINLGMDPTVSTFGENLAPAQEQAVQDAATKIWGMPYNYYDNLPGSIGATRDAKAKGVEAQINYNPTRNWTTKFTFGKQETVYSNVLKQFDAWYAVRAPVWMSAKATDYLQPQYKQLATYTTAGGRQVNLTNFWTSYGFNSAVDLNDQFGNTNVQNYYNINVQPQYALARDLNGQSAPGQRKYRWSFLTNYRFTEEVFGGRLKGFAVGGSERWEDKAVIGYYGKSSGAVPGVMDVSDTTKPNFDRANSYTDLWVSYSRRLMNDRVGMKLQLNVVDAFENGGLRTVGVNYDGTPYAFRIVDPRQFIFTATFNF